MDICLDDKPKQTINLRSNIDQIDYINYTLELGYHTIKFVLNKFASLWKIEYLDYFIILIISSSSFTSSNKIPDSDIFKGLLPYIAIYLFSCMLGVLYSDPLMNK